MDAVSHRPEFANQRIEVFQDADRSGKETSRRVDYLRMLERIRAATPGEIAAVASYDIDRLHRNDLEFFRLMAEMTERRILVFDGQGLVSAVDQLPWKVKAIVAQEERVKVARRVRDNLRYLKRTGHLAGLERCCCSSVRAIITDLDPAQHVRRLEARLVNFGLSERAQ